MKLPDDKQQRVKIFVMIGLGAALVVLGIVQGIINPLRTSRANRMVRMEECQRGVERARKEIKKAARSFTHRMETLDSIKRASDQYILHPVLGNYLLEATGIIEAHASALNIAIDPVREVAISDIPRNANAKKDRLLKAYTVRVNLVAPYHDAFAMMREIENQNPYVCITSVMIRPRTGVDIERHSISIEVQWPVWADPEFPAEIEEQLKEQISKQVEEEEDAPAPEAIPEPEQGAAV
ncbi:MAG: hypothetical protein HN919_13330 [Verrucomicrobia bacterium]|jgi:hypothetical protein|nr:hypothetical protein [Verrucomicrobiota bacterium]MBT7067282.1 hypothetical protein [Verrucomicrobiota bacterium]MBT7698680.1 hypothetical protein [Verrucomicrobiota bacterium]